MDDGNERQGLTRRSLLAGLAGGGAMAAAIKLIGGCGGGTSTPGTKGANPFLVMSNATDPMFVTVALPDGRSADVFGARDAIGIPTSLAQLHVRDGNGASIKYFYDDQHRIMKVITAAGTLFTFDWSTSTTAAVAVVTHDGAAQINTQIDISKAKAVKPLGRSSIAYPGKNLAPRGGVRVQAGIAPARSVRSARAAPAATAESVTINVLQCGTPTSSADVYVVVHDAVLDTFLGQFPATATGNGVFTATIPSGTAPELNLGEVCSTLASVLGFTCDTLVENPGALDFLCTTLAGVVAASEVGAVFADEVLTGCEALSQSLELYCKTLNASPVKGSPSLADMLCEAKVLDRKFVEDIILIPEVIALPDNVIGSVTRAPGEGPYPALVVDLGDSTVIRSLKLNPSAPVAQEGYVGTADIFCVPSGAVVELSIVGTDGYTDSVITNVSTTMKDGVFTLDVPGAATAGIMDTVTLKLTLPDSSVQTRVATLVFG